jgi:hypothetical protein
VYMCVCVCVCVYRETSGGSSPGKTGGAMQTDLGCCCPTSRRSPGRKTPRCDCRKCLQASTCHIIIYVLRHHLTCHIITSSHHHLYVTPSPHVSHHHLMCHVIIYMSHQYLICRIINLYVISSPYVSHHHQYVTSSLDMTHHHLTCYIII